MYLAGVIICSNISTSIFSDMFPMFYPCYNLLSPFWKAINTTVRLQSIRPVENVLILLWYRGGMWNVHSNGIFKTQCGEQTLRGWNLSSLQEVGMEFHLYHTFILWFLPFLPGDWNPLLNHFFLTSGQYHWPWDNYRGKIQSVWFNKWCIFSLMSRLLSRCLCRLVVADIAQISVISYVLTNENGFTIIIFFLNLYC